MWDNFEFSNIAIVGVIASIILLIYFAVKTLITANLFHKGVTLYQQEDYPGAEAAFRQVISINSTNDVVHLLLGDALMQQNQVDAAISEFQEVINRAPKKVDAYLRLANAFLRQEKTQEAVNILEKARDLFQSQRQPDKAEKVNSLLQRIKP